MIKMQRSKVYELIDGERNYQVDYCKEKNYKESHELGEHILLMNEYSDRIRKLWTDNSGQIDEEKKIIIDEIIKLSAICVRCLEEHGM